MNRFFSLFISLLMLISPIAQAKAKAGKSTRPAAAPKPEADWTYAEKQMRKAGLGPKFLKALKKTYEPDSFREVLELNTLLFLRKSDYHGVQVNDDAVTEVRTFMDSNRNSLAVAEKAYGVDGSVVASLLWIESRHGKNLGAFHVPSVFVDLVQCDRPANIKYLHKAGRRFTAKVTAQNKIDISKRARKRVKWALAELKAVETMWKRDKSTLIDFRGSFAGAFGMAQFIPSSYIAYAKSQVGDHPPILEHAEDAIQSVANYLHKSGWRAGKQKSHVKALMRYNNSHDYANAILKLASQASTEERTPAGN